MADIPNPQNTKEELYRDSWHAEKPYSKDEAVRLWKACDQFIAHAKQENRSGKYTLMDIGCGVGPLREWLAKESFHITGLELSEESALVAKKNYDDCLVGDVEQPWPVEDRSLNGIHMGAVLEHVLDWHAPLNQANRTLKDNGLLVVSVPNLRYWKEIRRLIKGRQPHWLVSMKHIHGYTPQFLKTLVELHGFKTVSMEADRLNIPLLSNTGTRTCKWLAGWGSVIILAAQLVRRTTVVCDSLKGNYKNIRQLPLRSIEILDSE